MCGSSICQQGKVGPLGMLTACLHLQPRAMRVTSETSAEMRALLATGADVVCMPTVLKALSLEGTGARCVGVAVAAKRGRESGDHT
jgi:hypothetical protein